MAPLNILHILLSILLNFIDKSYCKGVMNFYMGNDAEVHLAFPPIPRKLMKLWKSWDSSVEMEDSEKKSSPLS